MARSVPASDSDSSQPTIHARQWRSQPDPQSCDGPLDNPEGEAAELARSFALGFTARAAIHPKQIAAIHAAMRPLPAEVEQARRVIAAFADGAGRACLLDGRLVERPLVEASRRVLARAPLEPAP